jgi:hypothetical protein
VAALFADQHTGRVVDQQPTEDFAFRRHLLRTSMRLWLERCNSRATELMAAVTGSYDFRARLPAVTKNVTSRRRSTQRHKPTPIADMFYCDCVRVTLSMTR